MKKNIKLGDKESRYLAKSVLLEESGSPVIIRLIIVFCTVIVFVFIMWANNTVIEETAVAPGQVVPVGKSHRIQHVTGGIVSELYVQESTPVTEGQVLLKFNTDMVMSELQQYTTRQDSLMLQKIRLESLIEGKIPNFSQITTEHQDFVKDQQRIFAHLESYQRSLRTVFQNQNDKYRADLDDLAEQRKMIMELSAVNEELFHTGENVKRIKEKLANLSIKSPVNGVVHGLKLYSPGEITGPGEVIMEIIPLNTLMIAEIQISSRDIGHVRIGQGVTLKFTTYDFSRYGGMKAELDEISPSTFLDRTGNPYYKGIVKLPNSFLVSQETTPILPGMTLQADIRTGEKTVMEYLLKPIFASAKKALHER
ncbi:MAG: HlyD family efflux transporter periplasmic adaptor subunit [SAR324 cluster bacterium]|nr:HlyD family efflux transporter periplasmic adaptor subunit [SAR324 cluster bacterium]